MKQKILGNAKKSHSPGEVYNFDQNILHIPENTEQNK